MNARTRYVAAQNRLLDTHGVAATSRFLELPWRGHRTHVLHVEGDNRSGAPVVFIHGGGCFAAIWASLLAQLDDRPLFAVDRPGFGLTEPMEQGPDTLRHNAVAFLEGLLDALDIEQGRLVANSMGSLWTFWLALDAPSRVERMIHVGCPAMLLDTGAPLPLRLLATPLVGQLMMALRPPTLDTIHSTLEAMGEGEALRANSALADAWLASEQLPSFAAAWHGVLHSVLTILGPRTGVPLTCETLTRVRAPTQFIWGEDDPFGSVETPQHAAECLPQAGWSVVPGGHLPWLDAPDQVADLIAEVLKDHD